MGTTPSGASASATALRPRPVNRSHHLHPAPADPTSQPKGTDAFPSHRTTLARLEGDQRPTFHPSPTSPTVYPAGGFAPLLPAFAPTDQRRTGLITLPVHSQRERSGVWQQVHEAESPPDRWKPPTSSQVGLQPGCHLQLSSPKPRQRSKSSTPNRGKHDQRAMSSSVVGRLPFVRRSSIRERMR